MTSKTGFSSFLLPFGVPGAHVGAQVGSRDAFLLTADRVQYGVVVFCAVLVLDPDAFRFVDGFDGSVEVAILGEVQLSVLILVRIYPSLAHLEHVLALVLLLIFQSRNHQSLGFLLR